MFADRKVSFEEMKEKFGLKMTKDEYVMSVAKNALTLESALIKKGSILNSVDCQHFHKLMCHQV